MMIAITDVHYHDDGATAACVVAEWTDESPRAEYVAQVEEVAEYEPGQFYRRELPCLLSVLDQVNLDEIDAIVIDGYVWLDEAGRAGLGCHLWRALDREIEVIGVAKNPYREANFAEEVLRGESERPLYVTTTAPDSKAAATRVAEMHGPYRMPTLLRYVDQLCRSLLDGS